MCIFAGLIKYSSYTKIIWMVISCVMLFWSMQSDGASSSCLSSKSFFKRQFGSFISSPYSLSPGLDFPVTSRYSSGASLSALAMITGGANGLNDFTINSGSLPVIASRVSFLYIYLFIFLYQRIYLHSLMLVAVSDQASSNTSSEDDINYNSIFCKNEARNIIIESRWTRESG